MGGDAAVTSSRKHQSRLHWRRRRKRSERNSSSTSLAERQASKQSRYSFDKSLSKVSSRPAVPSSAADSLPSPSADVAEVCSPRKALVRRRLRAGVGASRLTPSSSFGGGSSGTAASSPFLKHPKHKSMVNARCRHHSSSLDFFSRDERARGGGPGVSSSSSNESIYSSK